MENLEKIKTEALSIYKKIDDKESIITKSIIVTFVMMIFSLSINSILLDFTILFATLGCWSLYYLQYSVDLEEKGIVRLEKVYLWTIVSVFCVVDILTKF